MRRNGCIAGGTGWEAANRKTIAMCQMVVLLHRANADTLRGMQEGNYHHKPDATKWHEWNLNNERAVKKKPQRGPGLAHIHRDEAAL